MNDTSLAREVSRLRGAVQELVKEQHRANQIAIDIEVRRTQRENKDIEEIDRNARAYGYEAAMRQEIRETYPDVPDGNPFVDPNWRKKIGSETSAGDQVVPS
jgi:hypothetical protein